jgi:membrane fusion protein, adhesin transport system
MITRTQLTAFRLRSLELVESPLLVRRWAYVLLYSLVALFLAMVFVPWQQTTHGTGNVIAYSPLERPQTVEAPIYGRVVQWGEGIVEGAVVKKDQFILEIRDVDAERANRLQSQVAATADKVRFSEKKVEIYRRQINDLQEARAMVIEAGKALGDEAERKVEAEQQSVLAAEAALAQTQSNYERQKKLLNAGALSGTSFEKDQRSFEEAQAKKKAAEAYVQAARDYLTAKRAELEQKSREAETKVDYARAMEQESLGEFALARKELSEIEGKSSQFASRVITAPRDGLILRLFANENAEMLKEGDPLFTIVPDTNDRAIELWVNGNDVPLVTRDKEVRIQFEGWPAVQFAAGWPRATLGTFGGTVMNVDATDNGAGKFRVLVRPLAGETWPDARFLRQGVRANGWIMLNQVTLGYEVWRQLNGFPPVFDSKTKNADNKENKDLKKVKLPK